MVLAKTMIPHSTFAVAFETSTCTMGEVIAQSHFMEDVKQRWNLSVVRLRATAALDHRMRSLSYCTTHFFCFLSSFAATALPDSGSLRNTAGVTTAKSKCKLPVPSNNHPLAASQPA